MNVIWKKKVGASLVAASMLAGAAPVMPVLAAADNIEIILTDVTAEHQDTLKGEAKIKVSVKGAGGKVSAAQTALKFEGDLKYKSIEFLQGENNPPECFYIPPNAALVNNTKKLLPSIVTNTAGSFTFTDDVTDLFILTFAGEPGDSVTLSLDGDSAAGSFCAVDGKDIKTVGGAAVSEDAAASSESNEGMKASVKLTMDKVTDFAVSTGEGYADSRLTLTITNEKTGATISTILNTVSVSKGGHYDSTVTTPTFIVDNTVLSGDTYTVELSGAGYVTYKKTGVDFASALELTNADLKPGDVNSDGVVNAEDKKQFEEMKGGEYSEYADFNRDGKIDQYP